MPAAVLVPSLISAGTSIVGGIMGSKASKNAAKTQVESGERALGTLGSLYQQQQAAHQPYMQLGQSALGNLGALVGRPQAMPTANPATMGPGPSGQRGTPFGQTVGQSMLRPGGGGGPVRMRAPDGSENAVPPDQVQFFLQRGAQVI